MIIDKIQNQHLYRALGNKFQKAFDFINSTNLENTASGNYEIDGEDIFAIVNEYETKHVDDCNFEGHYRYIDLQYVISGYEYIGLELKSDQIPMEQNPEKDYDFYQLKSTLVKFESGMFMIFFPDDLHMPGVHIENSSHVKKVVIKILI